MECTACLEHYADEADALFNAVPGSSFDFFAAATAAADGHVVVDVSSTNSVKCKGAVSLVLVNLSDNKPDADLAALGRACPGLESLALVRCVPLGSFGSLPSLKTIAYLDPHPPDDAMPALETVKDIDVLALDALAHLDLFPRARPGRVYIPRWPTCAALQHAGGDPLDSPDSRNFNGVCVKRRADFYQHVADGALGHGAFRRLDFVTTK